MGNKLKEIEIGYGNNERINEKERYIDELDATENKYAYVSITKQSTIKKIVK